MVNKNNCHSEVSFSESRNLMRVGGPTPSKGETNVQPAAGGRRRSDWPSHAIAAALFLLASCSSTRHLGEGEVLYTGVRKMQVEGSELPSGVEAAVRGTLSVKPNNPLFSPYVRTPLPVGLWAWNAFYTQRQTGFKAWMMRNFGKKPVLISDVRPELRASAVTNILADHGYFHSSASSSQLPRGAKKAKVNYHVNVAQEWRYASVSFPRGIDTLVKETKIRVGERYDADTLSDERVRITNLLRGDAHYYFRPEYLEYLADTTVKSGDVHLRMVMASDTPVAALDRYRIGRVNISIANARGRGTWVDTAYNGMKIHYQRPLRVRPKIFRRTLVIAPGRPARIEMMNATLTRLTKLGIFSSVNMAVTPLDSLQSDSLDIDLSMAMDTPMDVELEGDFSYTSSSFIGPKAILSLNHKNFLHGGEVFSVKLSGGYQWQTGDRPDGAAAINSYEVGLSTSLMQPRVVAPNFIIRRLRNRYDQRTTWQLGGDILNRPQFFRMLSLGGSLSYDFQTSRQSFHKLTLLKFTYNKLLSTTAAFDQRMAENPIINRSFDDQLIASLSYTYTLDRTFGHNQIVWQTTAMSSGNMLAGIHSLTGKPRPGKVFGNPFSQFVKGTSELKFYKSIGRMTLASRLMVGAAHAYGNWPYMPYTELFTIGGANSIRAYTIRSLGPGSYRPAAGDRWGYLDQAGTFKLEANVELRFPIWSSLHGAVFLDAGNIWLLENDPGRPGGHLGARDFLSSIATGTGAGLRYDLSFLVVRADAGVGIHLPYATSRPGYYNIPRFKNALGLHLAIGYPF